MLEFLRVLYVLATWRLLRGKAGLFDTTRIHLRVLPGEIDFNLHMNNGRYFSAADIGRLDWGMRTNLWRKALRLGWRSVAGGSSARFARSLQPFRRYALDTRLLGWNEKWFFCEHRFIRKEQVYATVLVRYVFLSKRGSVPPQKVLQMTGHDGASPTLPDYMQRWHESQEALTAALRAERSAALPSA